MLWYVKNSTKLQNAHETVFYHIISIISITNIVHIKCRNSKHLRKKKVSKYWTLQLQHFTIVVYNVEVIFRKWMYLIKIVVCSFQKNISIFLTFPYESNKVLNTLHLRHKHDTKTPLHMQIWWSDGPQLCSISERADRIAPENGNSSHGGHCWRERKPVKYGVEAKFTPR